MKVSEIRDWRCVPLASFSPCQEAPPAVTKYNRLSHSNTRNLLLMVLEARRTKSRCQYGGFLVDISFRLALVKHCAASLWPPCHLVGEIHCHRNSFSHSDKVSFLCSLLDRWFLCSQFAEFCLSHFLVWISLSLSCLDLTQLLKCVL